MNYGILACEVLLFLDAEGKQISKKRVPNIELHGLTDNVYWVKRLGTDEAEERVGYYAAKLREDGIIVDPEPRIQSPKKKGFLAKLFGK